MLTAALLASVVFVALAALVTWPWRVEATLKTTTSSSAVSLAGGLEVAGVSASAGAILGGPGVVAVHLRGREVWRRSIARVSVEAALDWVDELVSKPASPKRERGKTASWLLSRTDLSALPAFGLRLLAGLRELAVNGAITCGFADPALTGKAAAWLFPIAGVLAPFGALDVSFDWSGRTRLDGQVEISFRFVPARVAREALRFAWLHVHVRRPRALPSSTIPSITTG